MADCRGATAESHYPPMTTEMPTSMRQHKNKTVAALLAFFFGSVGLHRFYLRGMQDPWGWLHAACFPLAGLLILVTGKPVSPFVAAPIVLSLLASFMETLLIGLTPDEKWDERQNSDSGKKSDSGGMVPLILVITLAVGATALIAAIARTFDLLFTGGAYG
jgi:hypothetical protein